MKNNAQYLFDQLLLTSHNLNQIEARLKEIDQPKPNTTLKKKHSSQGLIIIPPISGTIIGLLAFPTNIEMFLQNAILSTGCLYLGSICIKFKNTILKEENSRQVPEQKEPNNTEDVIREKEVLSKRRKILERRLKHQIKAYKNLIHTKENQKIK